MLHCGAFSDHIYLATDKLNVSTIIIVGLTPSSSYSLYCYAFYAGLYLRRNEDMIANMREVNTAFCKSITIRRVSNVITSGVDTAKFFSVQVDGLPSYSIGVFITEYYRDSNLPTESYFDRLQQFSILCYSPFIAGRSIHICRNCS